VKEEKEDYWQCCYDKNQYYKS